MEGKEAQQAAEGNAAPEPHAQAGVRDESQLWRDIAAAAFASDGIADGWDSDNGVEPLSSEDKYLKVHLVPRVLCLFETIQICDPVGRPGSTCLITCALRPLPTTYDADRAPS